MTTTMFRVDDVVCRRTGGPERIVVGVELRKSREQGTEHVVQVAVGMTAIWTPSEGLMLLRRPVRVGDVLRWKGENAVTYGDRTVSAVTPAMVSSVEGGALCEREQLARLFEHDDGTAIEPPPIDTAASTTAPFDLFADLTAECDRQIAAAVMGETALDRLNAGLVIAPKPKDPNCAGRERRFCETHAWEYFVGDGCGKCFTAEARATLGGVPFPTRPIALPSKPKVTTLVLGPGETQPTRETQSCEKHSRTWYVGTQGECRDCVAAMTAINGGGEWKPSAPIVIGATGPGKRAGNLKPGETMVYGEAGFTARPAAHSFAAACRCGYTTVHALGSLDPKEGRCAHTWRWDVTMGAEGAYECTNCGIHVGARALAHARDGATDLLCDEALLTRRLFATDPEVIAYVRSRADAAMPPETVSRWSTSLGRTETVRAHHPDFGYTLSLASKVTTAMQTAWTLGMRGNAANATKAQRESVEAVCWKRAVDRAAAMMGIGGGR